MASTFRMVHIGLQGRLIDSRVQKHALPKIIPLPKPYGLATRSKCQTSFVSESPLQTELSPAKFRWHAQIGLRNSSCTIEAQTPGYLLRFRETGYVSSRVGCDYFKLPASRSHGNTQHCSCQPCREVCKVGLIHRPQTLCVKMVWSKHMETERDGGDSVIPSGWPDGG